MKIEEKVKTVSFRELTEGNAFIFRKGYFLKTEPLDGEDGSTFNAVDLCTGGASYYFEDYCQVEKVNAKVVIEDVPDDTDYCNNDCEHCEWVTCPKETFRKVFEVDDDVEVEMRINGEEVKIPL